MCVTVKATSPSDAEELSQIQKAAFKPLYDKYHDARNPYLRSAEDVLCRLNKLYRHFTILYDGKTVGGIFYRMHGKWNPTDELGAGEYYLGRLYIHPDFQSRGIARDAILLCEKEFPDAKAFYVDFPDDMEKNRRCYYNAGYRDTGEKICEEGAPTLALYKKTVTPAPMHADVSMPMIFEAEKDELGECLSVIHRSFETVADEFGLTQENCPKHTSFMPLSYLETQMARGWNMYGLYAGKKIIGYMSLSKESDGTFELHNLAVLPEYRCKGFGKQLLDFAAETVRSLGGTKIRIGIIDEHTVLKNWYIKNGFTETGLKKFDHLPFTSGYLERNV